MPHYQIWTDSWTQSSTVNHGYQTKDLITPPSRSLKQIWGKGVDAIHDENAQGLRKQIRNLTQKLQTGHANTTARLCRTVTLPRMCTYLLAIRLLGCATTRGHPDRRGFACPDSVVPWLLTGEGLAAVVWCLNAVRLARRDRNSNALSYVV